MRTKIKHLLRVQQQPSKPDVEVEVEVPKVKEELKPIIDKVPPKTPNDKPVMQSMSSPGQKEGMLMTTYTTQKGHKVQMPRIWSVANFGKHILAHNTTSLVTNVVCIGKTGSGKTTCCKRVIHDIHTRAMGKGYIIKWFSEEDMLNLKNILPKLSKHRNYIMVWDDISFVEKKYGLNQKQTAELASLMATLRHKYLSETSHLINFSLIHYSKAVGKGTGFRQGDFTIATSITQNEKMNFYEIFDKYSLDNFAKMYRLALLNGKFSVNADAWSDKVFDYYIRDVHPVLVSEINHPHPMLVDQIFCQVCGQDKYNQDMKRIATADEFVDQIPKTLTKFQGTAIRLWAYLKSGNDLCLKPQMRWAFRLLDKISQNMDIPVEEILDKIYIKDHSEGGDMWKKDQGTQRAMAKGILGRPRKKGNNGSVGIKKDGMDKAFKHFDQKGKLKGKNVKVIDYLTMRKGEIETQIKELEKPKDEKYGQEKREQENQTV